MEEPEKTEEMHYGTRENTDNRDAGKSAQASYNENEMKNEEAYSNDVDFILVGNAGFGVYDRCIWFKPAEI